MSREAQLQRAGAGSSSLRDSGRWPGRCKHQAAPARLQTRLALPSWQTLVGIFGSSQRGAGAEAPEMLQSSPARQLPPSISRRDPRAVPGAHTGSHLLLLAPTGPRFLWSLWFLWNLSSQPPWMAPDTRAATLHIHQVPQGSGERRQKIPLKATFKYQKSAGAGVLTVTPPNLLRDTALLLSCLPPVLWLKISQGCSRCL